MDTPVAVIRGRARLPLAALGKLSVVGVAGIGLGLVYLQAATIRMLIPPLAVFSLISFMVAGSIAMGWRWAPLLGALWSMFIIAGNSAEIAYSLSHPTALRELAFTLFMLAMGALGLVGGIGATVQNYRGSQREAPRALGAGIALLVGLVAGVLLAASLAAGSISAGVSPETLAGLPALTIANYVFEQQELRVRAGEMVALRLENRDSDGHSLDIDAFGVHVLMPSGESSLALFTPSQPGTYLFYCAPHYDKTTGEGMKGVLIVE